MSVKKAGNEEELCTAGAHTCNFRLCTVLKLAEGVMQNFLKAAESSDDANNSKCTFAMQKNSKEDALPRTY